MSDAPQPPMAPEIAGTGSMDNDDSSVSEFDSAERVGSNIPTHDTTLAEAVLLRTNAVDESGRLLASSTPRDAASMQSLLLLGDRGRADRLAAAPVAASSGSPSILFPSTMGRLFETSHPSLPPAGPTDPSSRLPSFFQSVPCCHHLGRLHRWRYRWLRWYVLW